MPKTALLSLVLLGSICASSQIKRTSIPMGDALTKALTKSSLISEGAKPFHVRVVVSEPENPESPYQGTIEEWWVSPNQWRREVTTRDGMKQTIVVVDGKKSEQDEGDYFPLWLRKFVTALIDPVPNSAAWTASGISIEQITLPNGDKSDACARAKSEIGSGDQATDAFSNVCFDGEGRLKFVGSPGYSMEFHDYRSFGKKQIAQKLIDDPEPGTTLVGEVVKLEEESHAGDSQKLFASLSTDDNKFGSVSVGSEQMEQLIAGNPPIQWPSVRSGNVKGHLAMYISVDTEGRVREAWPLNSDNAGLEESALNQVRNWKLRPATDSSGQKVQVDGGLGFAFDTKIEDPLPAITGQQIAEFVSGCNYNPILPKGILPSGTSFKIRVSVDEEGKDTGESYPGGIPWKAIQSTGFNSRSCNYKPYMENGKPTYHYIDFVFPAP
jgi:hypothetical protein